MPWHRVVASNGSISSRGPGTDGAQRQKDALEAEGIEVTVTRGGELRVDFHASGWFPAAGTVDTGMQPAAVEDDGDGEEAEESEHDSE